MARERLPLLLIGCAQDGAAMDAGRSGAERRWELGALEKMGQFSI